MTAPRIGPGIHAHGKAMVVLSGGQDSATCMALAALRHEEVHAITFNYGQRHIRELQAARDVAFFCGAASHEIIDVGPNVLHGTSPLTDPSQPLEQYEDFGSMDKIIGSRVEKTFVPMRNALFLTLAANRAVCLGIQKVYTGVCEADNANYPDCRASFIQAQEDTINEALGFDLSDLRYISIETPLMQLSKAASIGMLERTVDGLWLLAFTHTAYDGQYPPLGSDHATILRAEGFRQAGIPDPLMVRAWMEGLIPYPKGAPYDTQWAQDHGQDLIDQIKMGMACLKAREPQGTLLTEDADHGEGAQA